MRIFHITKYLPYHPGGIERVCALFAKTAKSSGFTVRICGVHDPLQPVLTHDFSEAELLPLSSRKKLGPVEWADGYFHLQDELEKADVVHLHMPNPLAELAVIKLWPRLKRKPVLIPIFHAGILRFPPMNRIWAKTVHKKVLKISDGIIAAAPQVLTAFHDYTAFKDKIIGSRESIVIT